MRDHRLLVLLALLSCALPARAACAQEEAPAGVTMTPDQLHLLVNKQLGDERWTINVNLQPSGVDDGAPRIVSITGNVFRVDSTDLALDFVYCQPEPGSTGSLADPSSIVRLRCQGTGACAAGSTGCENRESCGAVKCARAGWSEIATGLEIPADFFLPPGGWDPAEPVASADARPWSDQLVRVVSDAAAWLAGRSTIVLPATAGAQTVTNGGTTMTIDLLHHLVVRDLSGERWSIVLNMAPDDTRAGGFRIASVTGNVFQAVGEPNFVYCLPTPGSALNLESEAQELDFTCLGTSACDASAIECSTQWVQTADRVHVPATFFLPDGGRGSPATSDPELGITGAVGRLPSIASPEFHLPGQGGQPAQCTDGAPCLVSRIGLCEDVPGRQLSLGGTCHCLVDGISPHCVRCGDPAVGPRIPAVCGAGCTFDVGMPLDAQGRETGIRHDARGVCLPIDADSPHCYCHAIADGRVRSVTSCGNRTSPCADGGCCIDDPRDGCRPRQGDLDCPGMCIGRAEGATGALACGLRTSATQVCGDGIVEGSELCDPADTVSGAFACSTLGLAGGEYECVDCMPKDASMATPEEGGVCTDTGAAPTLAVTIPDSVPVYGRTPLRGTYQDDDGDVTTLVLIASDGTEYRWEVPDARGRTSGELEFSLTCNGNSTDARFRALLEDAAKHRGAEVEIVLPCADAAPLCGDGARQDGEACDSSARAGSGCTEGTVCANDCSGCNPSDSCRGRCCPSPGTFCAPSSEACACDPGCGERGDCCADVLDECGY